jgi:hypothetical protein
MCPLCISNIVILATTSGGGVLALAIKAFGRKNQRSEQQKHDQIPEVTKRKEIT